MTPSQAGHRKLKAVAVVLSALIIAAVAAELVLRFAFGLGNTLLFATDPACGYLPRPNQHVRRFFAVTDINQFGMRCASFTPQKKPGTLRIMFVGDSIVYGTTQVDQSRIFATIVGRELPKKIAKPVDELNASAGGWSIANEYGFLQSRGTFGSDYVFLVVNSGDMTQRSSSLEDIGGEALTHKRLALAELLEKIPSAIMRRVGKLDPGTQVGVDPGAEEINRVNLTKVKEVVSRDGSRLVILFVPFRATVARHAQLSANPSLREWAQSSSVLLMDMTPAVSSYPVEAITLPDRMHYNVEGNRILASAIEERIMALL